MLASAQTKKSEKARIIFGVVLIITICYLSAKAKYLIRDLRYRSMKQGK